MKRNPYLVIEWFDHETDARGWLVIDSLVDGLCAGGIRMNVTVDRDEVERLARVMSYKYVAVESRLGGCKGGIRYDYRKPDAYDVLKRYLKALKPYLENGVQVGEDLGTRYSDILRALEENDTGPALPEHIRNDPSFQEGSKNVTKLLATEVEGIDMNRVVTGFGVAAATDEAWKFYGGKPGATVAIQGFGSVGGSCALYLQKQGYKVVGIADINHLFYNKDGLNVKELLAARDVLGQIDPSKVSNCELLPTNQWLDLDVDILIPAAVENVINAETASRIKATMIVEAANIPTSPDGDEVIKRRGIKLVPDFVANGGACCFFDSVRNHKCPPTPEGVLERIGTVIRSATRRTLEAAQKNHTYTRDEAERIFSPPSN